MIKIIQCAIFIYVWCTEQTVHGGCPLDRNEHNKYPWMLRLVFDKVIISHAVLVTPKYMITAYEPVKTMIHNAKKLAQLDIIGQMYGPGGEIICSATRKARRLAPFVFDGKVIDEVAGLIKDAFEVTLSNPYIYADVKHYNQKAFNDKFAKIIDFECCMILFFDNRTAENPKIVEHKVTYLKGPTDQYWRKVVCKDSAQCLKKVNARNFFAYDPMMGDVKDFTWYKGAPIICDGDPLAITESQIKDPSTSTEVTMLHHIKTLAQHFYNYAMKEWPPQAREKEAKKKEDGNKPGRRGLTNGNNRGRPSEQILGMSVIILAIGSGRIN